MKKILVLSDSHGKLNPMLMAVEAESPDLIIHLGDCWEDAGRLKAKYPQIPMERVPGNCDYSNEQAERIIVVEGKRLFICHGHTFNVKMGYLNLELKSEELGVDATLFGHTHRAYYESNNGITFLNPGSIGSPPFETPASYGILEIDGCTDTLRYDVRFLE